MLNVSRSAALLLTVAPLTLSAPVRAQQQQPRTDGIAIAVEPAQRAAAQPRVTSRQLDKLQAKLALASEIVDRLQPTSLSEAQSAGWRRAALESLFRLSLSQLQRVEREAISAETLALTTARTLDDPQALGDTDDDLVYVPIPPCRWADSRFTGSGTHINGTVGFDLNLSGASYGGSAACHPETLFAVGAGFGGWGALVVNVTIVDPTQAPGFVAIKPTAASPVTSLLNWYEAGPFVQLANQGVVTVSQGGAPNDYVVQTSAPAHVIQDIFGAFLASHATALDRLIQQNQVTLPTGGAVTGVTSASCPATYTTTGGGCISNGQQVHINDSFPTGTNQWRCVAANFDAVVRTLTVNNICSRVPGR